MLVRPDERVPIARLLRFLEQGERLARDCATRQAALAPTAGMRRFLLGQARQESYHAWVFQGAIAWLSPRHLGRCSLLPPLERYRVLLQEALDAGRFAESLLAEQIILEGLGEAILKRVESGLTKRDAPFGRLRRILLHQEEAHHEFGLRVLERQLTQDPGVGESLRVRAQDYVALTEGMVTTLSALFESLDEDPAAYATDAKTYLPAWLSSQPGGEGQVAIGDGR